MKVYSTFLKALALDPYYQMVLCHIQETRWGGHTTAEMQLAYSIAPANWADNIKEKESGWYIL